MRTIDILTVLGLAVSQATAQLSASGIKLPLPTRELEWKDVNFISISDSHGMPLELCSPLTRLADGKAGCLDISM